MRVLPLSRFLASQTLPIWLLQATSMQPDSADARHLVADVGGTHARFALVTDARGELSNALTLDTADFPTLLDAVRHYLVQCGAPALRDAAIAIATPVLGDAVRMTNHHWSFSIEKTRRAIGVGRLLVLNDFAALALSLPALAASELRQVGGGAPVDEAPQALIGPGTGLGVSGLVPAGGGRWVPIAGEGGHVTLCAANNREADILRILRKKYPHVSAERVLSGAGLADVYHAIAQLGGRTPRNLGPAEVSGAGLAGSDPVCVEALETFCAMLGSVAGNLALTLGARGGLYIGGGIVPKLGEYFYRSPFRDRFEAKGRFTDYLAAIPTYVILSENAALRGAAMALNTSAAPAG